MFIHKYVCLQKTGVIKQNTGTPLHVSNKILILVVRQERPPVCQGAGEGMSCEDGKYSAIKRPLSMAVLCCMGKI